MNICGYGLRDHLRLLAPMFGLIAAVWLLRWVLDAAHVRRGLVLIVSVTGATSLCILLAATIIHARRFGSYVNVVVASFLLVTWGQLLITAAIVFAAVSGKGNIFTAPEFSRPGDGLLRNILGHLTFGIGAGTLFGAATGCLLLWLLRRLVPVPTSQDSRS